MTPSRNAMTREQRNDLLAYQRLSAAIVAVVNQTPAGARAEPMFAVAAPYIDRVGFDAMLRLLVIAERITQRGDLYFPAAR
jgi:hypothetical protein